MLAIATDISLCKAFFGDFVPVIVHSFLLSVGIIFHTLCMWTDTDLYRD